MAQEIAIISAEKPGVEITGNHFIRILAVLQRFFPCAAAALYRRDAFHAVQGFDEHYFCYYEDIDLAFRLWLSGYKGAYVPKAIVEHTGSATTKDIAIFIPIMGIATWFGLILKICLYPYCF